jgi:outer membrane immunogenic protein
LKNAYLAALAAIVVAAFAPASAHAQTRNIWNGWYVGLHGGYAWQDVNGVFNSANIPTKLSGSQNGGAVGGQLGYNYQSGQFLFGIEADLTSLTHDGNNYTVDYGGPVVNDRLASDYLGSVRARLGWAINDWLLYGTVGWGYSKAEFTRDAPADPFHGKVKLNGDGLVFGGGVEWMLTYGVSIRGEYLRYDIDRSRAVPGWFPEADVGDRFGFDTIDVARAALNIKLSN